MVKKELVSLLEQNIVLFAKLSERINRSHIKFQKYSRQQVQLLMRLFLIGRAKLKDIAALEFLPTPNVCTAFRKLERDGLVDRSIDEQDRRNTWYFVTESGAVVARGFIKVFDAAVSEIFRNISAQDEAELIGTLKSINNILMKMESTNA